MKNRRLLYAKEQKSEEINVSPLIDIVFILLIFFIVTTVFVEETGVDVQRPRATSAENLDKEAILLAITADDEVFYGGERIGVRGVRGIVRRILQKDPERPVIVQADREASVERYTEVHDEAALGGARHINLATRHKQP